MRSIDEGLGGGTSRVLFVVTCVASSTASRSMHLQLRAAKGRARAAVSAGSPAQVLTRFRACEGQNQRYSSSFYIPGGGGAILKFLIMGADTGRWRGCKNSRNGPQACDLDLPGALIFVAGNLWTAWQPMDRVADRTP